MKSKIINLLNKFFESKRVDKICWIILIIAMSVESIIITLAIISKIMGY